jgi:hypothetical protein
VPDPQGGLMLAWGTASTPPEIVGPRHVSGFLLPRLGVTGHGLGQPHILFIDPGDGTQPAHLDYATRDNSGWSSFVVAEDRHDSNCAAPSTIGDHCTTVDVLHTPTAVLTSGNGDVRLLYSRHEAVQEFITTCASNTCASTCAGDACFWSPTSSSSVDAVKLAWPTSSGIEETTIIDGVHSETASAVVDSLGRIHVVETSDQRVHYLSIIPG